MIFVIKNIHNLSVVFDVCKVELKLILISVFFENILKVKIFIMCCLNFLFCKNIFLYHMHFCIIFLYHISLSVRQGTCRQKQKECVETGGICISEATGIHCICPSDTSYIENKGCQGM